VLPDVEQPYRQTGNIALLIEALRCAVVGDDCPSWVAAAVLKVIEQERNGTRVIATWWRQHSKDLIHLRRAMAVEQGLRRGFSWPQAYEYAKEVLRGTPAFVEVEQIKKSHLLVIRESKRAPGRFMLTPTDIVWLQRDFPRPLERVRAEVAVIMEHRERAHANGLRSELARILPKSEHAARPLQVLADTLHVNKARLRAELKGIPGLRKAGSGRSGDPICYWRSGT
jgi:hypothetical protein